MVGPVLDVVGVAGEYLSVLWLERVEKNAFPNLKNKFCFVCFFLVQDFI